MPTGQLHCPATFVLTPSTGDVAGLARSLRSRRIAAVLAADTDPERATAEAAAGALGGLRVTVHTGLRGSADEVLADEADGYRGETALVVAGAPAIRATASAATNAAAAPVLSDVTAGQTVEVEVDENGLRLVRVLGTDVAAT